MTCPTSPTGTHAWVDESPVVDDGYLSCGYCGAKGPCAHAEERWDQVTGFVHCARCIEVLRFQCPWAEDGEAKCPEWRCDCFIDMFPESPFALHPEAFIVGPPVNVELPPFDPPEGTVVPIGPPVDVQLPPFDPFDPPEGTGEVPVAP